MRILYGIQGTGNGHVSRAREIIPHLSQYGELDLLVSGTQVDIQLPRPVKYRMRGLGYTFGKNGNIDIIRTVTDLRLGRLLGDIRSLPVEQYDLIVNDFEPVSAWAGWLHKKPVVALSHQAAFLSAKSPRPRKRSPLAELIFRHYAPCTKAVGFHFKKYDRFIHKPIIQTEVRQLNPHKGDHITVYLPAYTEDRLIEVFSQLREVRWEVFSKHAKSTSVHGNVTVRPVSHEAYLRSLEGCSGLLTGGGFEAPSEALYLGKMLMVVPMNMQYEQQCNAKALKLLGVPILSQFDQRAVPVLRNWLQEQAYVQVQYEDRTAGIIASLVQAQDGESGDEDVALHTRPPRRHLRAAMW